MKTVEERNRLVNENLPRAKRVAKIMANKFGQHADIDAITSSALLGLVQAAQRYVSSPSCSFASFADHRMKGQILEDHRTGREIPRHAQDAEKRYAKAEDRLFKQTGRKPTEAEMQAELGETDKRFAMTRVFVSSGRRCGATPDPTCRDDTAERRDWWAEALRGCNRREKMIMGLLYVDRLTYPEAGKAVGFSEAHVRAIEYGVLARMRSSPRLRRMLAEHEGRAA